MNYALTMAIFVLLLFNIPVIVLLGRLPFIANFKEAIQEKGPIGGTSDVTSYSRITGLVGAVIVTAFYWAVGNVALYKAFTQISDIRLIVNSVAPLFMVGSALFLPYAFNQIKSAFGAFGAGAAAVNAAAGAAGPSVGAVAPTPVSGAMTLTVANLSTAVDDSTFAAGVAAIGVQVNRDFQPLWGTGATLTASRMALSGPQANIDGAADAIIYVGDSSSDPTTGVSGAYGYHSLNYGELPYAFIYLDVCAQYGEAWTSTLSHEVLEMLVDPTTVLTVNGPAPPGVGTPGQTVRYDLEVCDPTQGDGYKVNNVTVSNFVTKAYFGMAGATAATNFLSLALAPFGVRPGGYLQYEDSAGTHQINGSKVDSRRKAARAVLAGYRRNGRREAGFRKHA